MIENDSELEQLLRGLPRRGPSEELDRRIAASMAHAVPRARPVWWIGVAASVAVLIGAGLAVSNVRRLKYAGHTGTVATTTVRTLPRSESGGTAAETAGAAPIEWSRTMSQTIDDGIVVEQDGVPYRQVRRETVQDYWWVDPATGAKAQIRVPTEQVVVYPEETY